MGVAKTLWSWGRMDHILLEGREIESRRQLRNFIGTNWKRKTGTPVNDHRRASALETRLDRKLVRCEGDSIQRMWIEERERNEIERERRRREDVTDMKHSQEGRVAARNKTSWSLLHWMLPKQLFIKDRWREETTTKRKKKVIFFMGMSGTKWYNQSS